MELLRESEIDYWFTTESGVHIPVRKGESKEEALNNKFRVPSYYDTKKIHGIAKDDKKTSFLYNNPNEEQLRKDKENWKKESEKYFVNLDRQVEDIQNLYKEHDKMFEEKRYTKELDEEYNKKEDELYENYYNSIYSNFDKDTINSLVNDGSFMTKEFNDRLRKYNFRGE